MILIKTGAFCKECDMDTPLILGPAQCRDPVDYDLALAQRQISGIEQTACHKLLEKPLVSGKGCEQYQRLHALGHDPIKALLNLYGKRGLSW